MSRFVSGMLVCTFLLAWIAEGQTSQDPLKQMRSVVIQKIDGKEYYIHTIKRGQTLYMICKAYGVDINEVIRENPEVKEGIKADQKIRIPVQDQKQEGQPGRTPLPPVREPKPPAGEDKAVKTDTVRTIVPFAPEVLPCGKDTTAAKKTYKVALMVPLYLSETDKIDPSTMSRDSLESFKSLQFIEFYEGFRLAVDSLEKAGLHLQLYVYDVTKDTAKTRQLLKNPEFRNMDLIVGLLYHRNFMTVADFAEKNRINLVNPISERSELVTGNPVVFKVRPSRKSQLGHLAAFMEQAFYRAQILIIRNGQYKDKDAADRLKAECAAKDLTVQVVEGQDGAIGRLSKTKENVIVSFTENSAYILDLSRRLSEIRNDYDLTLVGMPAWDEIEELETEYMVNLRTHIMSPYFIDYDNPGVKQFVRKFQERFHTDPEPLAFQGFDVAYYFLSALMKYGKNLQDCISGYPFKALQTTFEFTQTKNNGFENQHWEIYKYGNYKLVKVN